MISHSNRFLKVSFDYPRNLLIHLAQKFLERHVWARVCHLLLIINRVEMVHHVSEPGVHNDGGLLPSHRRQHFDDMDGKAFVVVFAPCQVDTNAQTLHI